MFSQLVLFCLQMPLQAEPSPGRQPPPPSRQIPSMQTPLQEDRSGRSPPPGKPDTPGKEHDQQAGGTHPTGMHPCLFMLLNMFSQTTIVKHR